jgi:hypothetical protein
VNYTCVIKFQKLILFVALLDVQGFVTNIFANTRKKMMYVSSPNVSSHALLILGKWCLRATNLYNREF